jgi:hypothetical protein
VTFSGILRDHRVSTSCRMGNLQHERARRNAHRVVRAALLASLALLTALPARAQDKKDANLRTVHGSVVDKDENPVASSAVYLLNVKTQSMQTHISDDAGNYSFSRLDPNEDYQIHAEHGELMSAVRTISSYDSRNDIEIVLKLSHPKPAN